MNSSRPSARGWGGREGGSKTRPHGRGIKVKIGDRQEERVEFTRMHDVAIVDVHGKTENRYSSPKVRITKSGFDPSAASSPERQRRSA